MGQNFDQAKRDNNFCPRPKILTVSVYAGQNMYPGVFYYQFNKHYLFLTSILLNIKRYFPTSPTMQGRLFQYQHL